MPGSVLCMSSCCASLFSRSHYSLAGEGSVSSPFTKSSSVGALPKSRSSPRLYPLDSTPGDSIGRIWQGSGEFFNIQMLSTLKHSPDPTNFQLKNSLLFRSGRPVQGSRVFVVSFVLLGGIANILQW